jgi:hypothetical protein
MTRAATRVLSKGVVALVVATTLGACWMEDDGTATADLAGTATADVAGGEAALCVAAVKFEGRLYLGRHVAAVPVGGEAGQAVTAPCNDGQPDEQDETPFPVLKIPGIDPSVAVATEAAEGYWVWVAGDEPYSTTLPAAVQKVIDASS